jgi:hypothetical protein
MCRVSRPSLFCSTIIPHSAFLVNSWDGQHLGAEKIIAYADSFQGSEPIREILYLKPATKGEFHRQEQKLAAGRLQL